jgi:hypothetical protein
VEAVEVEGETALDLYMNVGTPAGSLEVRSKQRDARADTQVYANRQPLQFPDAKSP